jgi:hypothetical protein
MHDTTSGSRDKPLHDAVVQGAVEAYGCTVTAAREFRDIPRWVAEGYLASLPASRAGASGFEGEGWNAEIEELEQQAVGSIVFNRIRIRVSGDKRAVERVWEQLAPLLYRGGA